MCFRGRKIRYHIFTPEEWNARLSICILERPFHTTPLQHIIQNQEISNHIIEIPLQLKIISENIRELEHFLNQENQNMKAKEGYGSLQRRLGPGLESGRSWGCKRECVKSCEKREGTGTLCEAATPFPGVGGSNQF